MYKEANKIRLRFSTTRGLLDVEQLWQLPLTDLSISIRNLSKELKKQESDDELEFLNEKTNTVDKTQKLRFDILKDIYITRKEEAAKIKADKEAKAQKEKILEIIANKKDESLHSKSIEELEAMIKD